MRFEEDLRRSSELHAILCEHRQLAADVSSLDKLVFCFQRLLKLRLKIEKFIQVSHFKRNVKNLQSFEGFLESLESGKLNWVVRIKSD